MDKIDFVAKRTTSKKKMHIQQFLNVRRENKRITNNGKKCKKTSRSQHWDKT